MCKDIPRLSAVVCRSFLVAAARLSVVSCLSLLVAAPRLAGQSIGLEPLQDRAVNLEVVKPSYARRDLKSGTFAVFLGGRYTLDRRPELVLVAELPFARVEKESSPYFGGGSRSESSIGNPYLGVELRNGTSAILGEVGVRLPLARTEDAILYDYAAVLRYMDPVERMEAFLQDVLSLHGGLSYRYRDASGFGFRARLSPIWWIDTGGFVGDEMELSVTYGARFWYESEVVALAAAFAGRALLTHDDLDTGQRTLHQLSFGTTLFAGGFVPALEVRVPLDEDLRRVFDLTLALNLGYRFH